MANVIITGCSRGIGYELAILFAKAGHQVLALSRNDVPIRFRSFGILDCNGPTFSSDTEGKVIVDRINGKVSIFWDLVRSLPNTNCNEKIRGKSTCPN